MAPGSAVLADHPKTVNFRENVATSPISASKGWVQLRLYVKQRRTVETDDLRELGEHGCPAVLVDYGSRTT
jgi:hypothetical protein